MHAMDADGPYERLDTLEKKVDHELKRIGHSNAFKLLGLGAELLYLVHNEMEQSPERRTLSMKVWRAIDARLDTLEAEPPPQGKKWFDPRGPLEEICEKLFPRLPRIAEGVTDLEGEVDDF